MAVTEDPATGASEALGGTGPIDITDRCVTLQLSNAKSLLLVWRSPEVRWDGEKRQILFTPGWKEGATTLRIRDGDTVTVGGESLESSDEPGTKPNPDWISRPNPRCSGELFSVHSVSR